MSFSINFSFTDKIFLLILFLAAPACYSYGEGSKQLNTGCTTLSTYIYLCNDFTSHCTSSLGLRSQFATYDATQSATDNERLYFVTQPGENVYMGFNGSGLGNTNHIVYRINHADGTPAMAEQNLPTSGPGYISTIQEACNGPSQLLPAGSGYNAILWSPGADTYYIEFSVKNNNTNAFVITTFNINLIDITIHDPTLNMVKPGRLYSKSWQFTESDDFTGINYILSDDGIVTSAEFSNMSGGAWIQYANQTGCGPDDWLNNRKSLFHEQALYPQYKIFLSPPDPAIFSIASAPGSIIGTPEGHPNCDGSVDFWVVVNRDGDVDIELSFVPATYAPTLVHSTVYEGITNHIIWDGLDGSPIPVPVPNNVQITFTVKYYNGLTNLPLYDVEGNTQGFQVHLYAPTGDEPHVFWDDENIIGPNTLDVKSNVATTGCLSPTSFPACHRWQGSGTNGFGNLNTINSWWYSVSASSSLVLMAEWRSPQAITFQGIPPVVCDGAQDLIINVDNELNTEVYHWTYTGTGGSFSPSNTTTNPSVTLNLIAGATSGNVTVFGTNANCGLTYPGPTSTFPVTINPLPNAAITPPGTTVICDGGSANLTASGGISYLWSNTSTTASITVASSGSFTVTVTDVNGCEKTASAAVSVSTLPTVTITTSRPPTLCQGESVDLTASLGANYQWSNSATTQTITIGTTGTYTVTVTDAGGCANSATQDVTVNPLPPASITPNGPSIFCQGGSVDLIAGGGTSYLWSNSATSQAINIISSGTYTVTVTDLNGCKNTANHAVTVNPLPPAMITPGGATTFCQGGSVNLAASGGTAYLWSNNSTTATITVVSGGTFQVTVTNADGCVNSATQSVTVNPLPVVSITPGGPTTFCQGGSVNLTAGGGGDYLWSTSATTAAISVVASGTYQVTVTNLYGCRNTSSQVVTVNPLPVTTFTGPATVCQDDPVTPVYTAPTDPFTTYTWSVPPPFSAKGTTVPDPGFPNIATVYWTGTGNARLKLEGTTNFGCYSSAFIDIFINAKPFVSLPFCFDQVTIPAAKPFILHGATPTGAAGTWSGEGVSFTGGKYQFDPSAVTGPFPKPVPVTYTYTNTNSCPASDTKTILIVMPPSFLCGDPSKPLADMRTTPIRTYSTFFKAGRCWMAENLDYGSEVTDWKAPQTDNCQPQKYCLSSSLGGCEAGGFYQWDELMAYDFREGSQGLCPPGWHVPTSNEWQSLINANQGNGIAGGPLKDLSLPDGFKSMLTGMNYLNTTWEFTTADNPHGTMFWTSTFDPASVKAVARGLNSVNHSVSWYENSKANAFTVRCIQNF